MDLELIFKNANPDIVIILLTSLFGFISWLVKSLVEKPIKESKETFNKFVEKRIELLTEVKTLLNFIAYFPSGKESLDYKEKLQDVLLKDGKACYLDKKIFDYVLKISIDPKTNEKLLLNTIKDIDKDLYLQISKIKDEVSFYRRYSNYNPFKKFIGFILLSLQYILSLALVITPLFLLIFGLITNLEMTILIVFSIFFICLIVIFRKNILKQIKKIMKMLFIFVHVRKSVGKL